MNNDQTEPPPRPSHHRDRWKLPRLLKPMSTADVATRTVSLDPGRKYFNLMAKRKRGEWHRDWLLTNWQYIKTSERRWKVIGEDGPELGGSKPGGIVRDPRLIPQSGEHTFHVDGRAWAVGDRTYPPPHHGGSAADV